jgi:hypothetical protein
MRDSVYADGREVEYVQWPDTADGMIDVNGTVREMTADEVAEWHRRNPPAPLVDPVDYPSEDERVASVALLTEDSVGYRAVVELLIAKGIITTAEVNAARTKAMQRLVLLADNPEVRRQMMVARLAAAEQLRG